MHRFALALVLAMSAAGPAAAERRRQGARPRGPLPLARGRDGGEGPRLGPGPQRREREGPRRPATSRRSRSASSTSSTRTPASRTSRSSGPGTTTSGATRRTPAASGGARRSPSTARTHPAWETVLDLDALGAAEKENWVWHGADCLKPRVRALPRLALARRRRRERRARVRPRGEGVREGRLLPARGQERASAGATRTRSTSAPTSAPAR